MNVPLSLLFVHLIGDFFLQSDWMALNKSKSLFALWLHCAVYSLCFIPWGLDFYLLTFAAHFITDAITSRITSRLWFINFHIEKLREFDVPHNVVIAAIATVKPTRHWFFVMIGVDQFIHCLTLALTLRFLS